MQDKIDLEKLKAEIGYKKTCKTCVDCGKCDSILKMALDEAKQMQADENVKPCESCKL